MSDFNLRRGKMIIVSPTPFSIMETRPLSSYNWAGKILLVAEDDYVGYLFLSDIISGTQAKVIRAVSVSEVLNVLQNGVKIDLLIFNVGLRDNDECKFICQIKKRHPRLPVLAITDKDCIIMHKTCIDAGCDTFINQHIDSFQMLTTIDELLQKN
jgi:DNA-binding NtrC family response regulator